MLLWVWRRHFVSVFQCIPVHIVRGVFWRKRGWVGWLNRPVSSSSWLLIASCVDICDRRFGCFRGAGPGAVVLLVVAEISVATCHSIPLVILSLFASITQIILNTSPDEVQKHLMLQSRVGLAVLQQPTAFIKIMLELHTVQPKSSQIIMHKPQHLCTFTHHTHHLVWAPKCFDLTSDIGCFFFFYCMWIFFL